MDKGLFFVCKQTCKAVLCLEFPCKLQGMTAKLLSGHLVIKLLKCDGEARTEYLRTMGDKSMIFYFSATGNSQYAAEKIAEETREKTVSIVDCMREKHFIFDLSKEERLGFILPVYFWGLPSIVREFLSQLELGTPGRPRPYTFCAVTYGTTVGQAAAFLNKALEAEGFCLDARFSIQMPDTWTPVFDLSDKAKNGRINRQADIRIAEIVEKIQQKTAGDFLERKVPAIAVKLFYPVYEKARGTRHFHVEDSCIGCGLCAKKCPVNAIEMREGKPVWVKDQCTACLGCLHRCPKFSIQYGGHTQTHGQYIHPGVKI